MSNNRNLTILALVLVVAGALYVLTSRQRSDVDVSGGFEDLYEGTLATADVWGIDVYKGSDPDAGFALVKRGDTWFVSSHFDAPANVNKIRTLLGNAEGAEGERRSDSADVLGAYALEDSQAVHLVIKNESGEPLLHWLVGKQSGQGGFLRRDGRNVAFLAGHNFLSDFGIWGDGITAPTHTSWLELQVFKAERDDIHSLELHSAAGTLVLRKEFAAAEAVSADSTGAAPPTPLEYEWRLEQPRSFLAKKTVADGMLGNLASLRARDVVGRDTDNPDYGLDSGDRVVLGFADGSTQTLRFGNALPGDESQLYLQKEGDPLVWALPSYLQKNIFKSVDELKPE